MAETIGIGVAARDYQFRCELTSSYNRPNSHALSAGSLKRINFGDIDSYIQVDLGNSFDFGNPSPNSATAVLNAPFLGIINEAFSLSGWRDPYVSLIVLEDVVFSWSGCFQPAELELSKLTWYVDGTKLYEKSFTTPVIVSVYDPRDNNLYLEPGCSIVSPTGPDDCDPDGVDYEASVDASLTPITGGNGWRWAAAGTEVWNYEEIELEVHSAPISSPPPGCTCSCSTTLPEIDIDSDYETASEWSFGLILNSSFEVSGTVNSLGTRSCDCPDACPGGPIIGEIFQSAWELIFKESYGKFVPINNIITNHTYNDCASCDCVTFLNFVSDPTCVVEEREQVTTTSAIKRSATRSTGERYCGEFVSGFPCVGTIGGPDCSQFPPGCVTEVDEDCTYYAFAEVFWGSPCEAIEGSNPDCIHDPKNNQYYFAYESGGDIYVSRCESSAFNSAGLISTQATNTGNCSSPALFMGLNGVLYLSYTDEDTGLIVLIFSTDKSKTWSSGITLISNAKYPRITGDAQNGRLFTAFKYVSGTSGVGNLHYVYLGPGVTTYPASSTIVDQTGSAIVVEDERFDISFSNDRHGRFSLVCKVSGETALAHYASSSYGASFTRLI